MDLPTPRGRTTSTDTVNKARRRSTRGARALTMRDITNYIRSVYLGRIVYEYCTCIKTERLWFSHILDARSSGSSSRTPALSGAAQKKRTHTLLTAMRDVRLVPPTQDLQPEAICDLEGGKSMIPAPTLLFSVASRGSYFSIFIGVHFCSVESDTSRCAAHRTRHASSRPFELVDPPATNVPHLVIL